MIIRRSFFLLALVLALPAGAFTQTFTATWKNPAASNVVYAGKKIVGLIVSNDMPLRQSTEEALARELTAEAEGRSCVSEMIPKEESATKIARRRGSSGRYRRRRHHAAPWHRQETRPTVVAWESAPYYGSLWGYYPYAWGATIDLSPNKTTVTAVVETLVFDVTGNRLLWAGTSETTNAKGAQELVKKLVKAAAEQMRKDGLIRKN